MKKINTLLAILVLTTTIANAKIWRVNNNSGITADYTTVQAAHDAASAGDTIHLEPSGTSYGNLTMTKRLVLVSSGAYITENPGFQASSNSGYLSTLTIANTGANGSVIMVKFSGDVNISNNVGNLLLQSCVTNYTGGAHFCCGYAGNINISNADNIIIKNSYVNNIYFSSNSNNIVIVNNIISNGVGCTSDCDGTIANNIIHANWTQNASSTLYNCTVENNIYNYGVQGSFGSCLVRNNLNSNTGLPAGNGNQNSVNMTNVFVNRAVGYGGADNAYVLKSGSPAIGAGSGGIDCGAFGGSTPFKLAVTPPIPSIYKLEVPSTPAGNTMNIKFSTRSNN
ncbi:MAG: hypothetical protein ACOVO1_08380 [Chitinophagaceae bacterium]